MARGKLTRTTEIERKLLLWAGSHPEDLVAHASTELRMSRQAVSAHLANLIHAGLLQTSGGRGARRISRVPVHHATMPLRGLQEDRVWDDHVSPHLIGIPPNVRSICQFGLTEMVNNAIDHSEGELLTVTVERTPDEISLGVLDDGVGIFKKIQHELQLHDQRQAILELSKGKFTTDPQRHSGQGIFFCARAFDRFALFGSTIALLCRYGQTPWAIAEREDEGGTFVRMSVALNIARDLKDVFDEFTTDLDEYSFDRTHVPLRLATYGDDHLISRSQARRVLARFEKFREVFLDFTEIHIIGQAFADEVFRVFHNQNPQVRLVHINACAPVLQMISRAQTAADSTQMSLFATPGEPPPSAASEAAKEGE